MTLKLTTIGNSTGVVLPKEILQRLRVDRGDTLYVLETAAAKEFAIQGFWIPHWPGPRTSSPIPTTKPRKVPP